MTRLRSIRALAIGAAGIWVLATSPALACEPVELHIIAHSSARDVLGVVEAVQFEGVAVRDFRIVRRWAATVRPVRALRGEPTEASFTYRFDDERPSCGWPDLQVEPGARAVFFFRPEQPSPYWAIRPSDYRLARPDLARPPG